MNTKSSGPASIVRDPALDLARAWATVAMVLGHTLQATMLVSDRELPGVVHYWHLRALTAPLFLIVSGWAVALSFANRTLPKFGHLRTKGLRILTLVCLGMALRFPNWAFARLLAGEPSILAHFFALDVLQAIGLFLGLGCVLFDLIVRPVSRAVMAAMVALAVILAAPALWSASEQWALPWRLIFAGTTSPFPVFPWLAYFMVGMSWGALASRGHNTAIAPWKIIGFGGVLVGISTGLGGAHFSADAGASPAEVGLNMGAVMAGLGVLGWVPSRWGPRVRILGRHTLAIYFIHMIIVYGGLGCPSLAHQIGNRLAFGSSLAAGLVVLGVSFGLAWLWSQVRRAIVKYRGLVVE